MAELSVERGWPCDRWVRAVLAAAREPDAAVIAAAVRAARLAAAHGLADLIRESLGHRVADDRQTALESLAESGRPLALGLLALATDKSSRVRRKLLDLLGDPPPREHLATLVVLAADDWSDHPPQNTEAQDHPIALGAAKRLLNAHALDDELLQPILTCANTTLDGAVAKVLYEVLIVHGGTRGRNKVVDLALKTGKPRRHRAAAYALWSQDTFISADMADRIGPEQLQRRSASIALPLAAVVGGRGSPDHVRRLAACLSEDSGRKPLLVPLILNATNHGPDLVEELLSGLETLQS